MLRVEDITHSYKSGNEWTSVLHKINFSVKKGEMVALLGSSGSGKSTLLNLMAGLMKPTEGHIYIADQDIVKMGENKLAEFRRKNIGFIFQAYELITSLTVRENVELPLVFQSVSPRARKAKALALLEQVGIPDKADLFPSQLSGGQQQRVSIARSLITEPSVIFADEPTGNLDSKTEEEIIGILLNLNRTMKTTFIVVTHEYKVAEQMQRIFTLKDGFLVTESQAKPQADIKLQKEQQLETQTEVQVEEQITEEAEPQTMVEVEEQLAAGAEQEAVEPVPQTAGADEDLPAEEPEHQTAEEADPAEGGKP
ncbi:ABC transporter-like protein [Paenibacillus sp. FSL R7-277]|nr:ABC transporter-like protein [Paenibacillus sp. FSL R7-277]